jgi:phenylpropionate dioxygenase-like ring-hydroxylating dioxygenase large terminal subunit
MMMSMASFRFVLLVLVSILQTSRAWISPSSPVNHRFRLKNPTAKRFVSTTSSQDSDAPASSSDEANKDDFSSSALDYNWKQQWYALTYASYLPNPSKSAEVTPAAVFGEPLVLWREEDDGTIYCAKDRCPHRAAALSEGRLRNGTLSCLYHGWKFSGAQGGECVDIPQLEAKAVIPKQSTCLEMKTLRIDEGIVWVWMDDETPPDRDPPCTNVLDAKGKANGWDVYDFQIDLPYDHTYLVENLLDPAHISISHDRTPGGGKRENAQAYNMQVDSDSISSRGFTGLFKFASAAEDRPFTKFEYEAPGIVRNTFKGELKGKELAFGAALHCMPLALGRSRLLFRTYSRGLPRLARWFISAKPEWLRHLNSCKILEQDAGLISTQEDHFARQNGDIQLQKVYRLIKSSDTYVSAYRRWLDRVGDGMPWFQGLARSGGSPYKHITTEGLLPPGLALAGHRASNENAGETRFHRHVMHCPTTRKAWQNIRRLKRVSVGLALVAATIATTVSAASTLTSTTTASAAVTNTMWRLLRRLLVRAAIVALPLSSLAAVALHRLEQEFYVSFKRRDQLRGESGLLP